MNEKKAPEMISGVPQIVMAAAAADVETVTALLNSGALVDSTDGCGRTALIAAAAESYFAENREQFERYVMTVKILIENGADAGIRDEQGNTAADHAYLSNEIENILNKSAAGVKP